ncbi:MAG: helicase-related protein [Desulfonauticus sp.]|nr:helicase-related protein [Desulfonauticus sp.]
MSKKGIFITNSKEKSLKSRIKILIEKSKELKFLVGFFYFSGIREFYEILKKLYEQNRLTQEHIKILVGLKLDECSFGLCEIDKTKKIFNVNKIKDDFYESIIKAFNSEEMDIQQTYEQVDFFLRLLEENKLVLKKTLYPNHAKLYLFKMNDSVKDIVANIFITGSSNFTKAGIESQDEFNVEIKDYGFDEAESYFDNLWKNAISITDNDVLQIKNIIKNKTFLREISPFLAFYYLLKLYFDIHKGSSVTEEFTTFLQKRGYHAYTYQLEAVSQAIANCETHGGSILADVVGLGKTVIACLVAKALGKRGIVICPPHLMGDENKTSGWKKYLEDFELWDWEVKSVGKLEEIFKLIKQHDNFDIIIVDEAHRFRNERTRSYHYLHEICRGKTVILLTATPFNNRPKDLFALLKLFTVPKKSTIVLDEDLEHKFSSYEIEFKKLAYIKNYHNSKDIKRRKQAETYYNELFKSLPINLNRVKTRTKKIAREIRSIIEPVVIRRNRLDLKYYQEKIELSEVKDPIEWFFELTQEQLNFYDKVIKSFASIYEGGLFKGAIYIPIKYEKELPDEPIDFFEDIKLSEEENFLYTYQKNLYDFMRRLMVKRFESSFGAFKESIIRFQKIHNICLSFINKTGKFLLDRSFMESISEEENDDILIKLKEYEENLKRENFDKKYYKVYDVEKFRQKEKFIQHMEEDLKLFEELLNEMDKTEISNYDAKAIKLIEGINKFLDQKRKVVIFTEYLDTAMYLKNVLEKEFPDQILSAFGNLNKNLIEELYKNFDAQYKEQEDKYQILLTTDKLSEGFNLNRAGAVINYDIPWNPVRVIQRVGRINRIGKKIYNEIYIVNFFPTKQGADIVKSREIAKTKMFMIHNVLGEDAKIFDPDEEPKKSKLYKRLNTYIEEEEESFFTKIKREYEKIKKENPNIEKEVKDLPNRIKVAKKGEKDELMVFVKKGKDIFVAYKDYREKRPVAVSFEHVYDKIKTNREDKSLRLSERFWENYHNILEKDLYRKKSSSSFLRRKASNLLNTIIQIDDKSIIPYKRFISDILEDIKRYHTLSEYFISKIIELEKYIKNPSDLAIQISKLENELGEDFLEKSINLIHGIKEEVIIAIENQEKNNA